MPTVNICKGTELSNSERTATAVISDYYTSIFLGPARSRDERTNHEATAPLLFQDKDWPKVAPQINS